uniref:Uncharacterized protein n=1 Tax=Acrobeloides nanus TaxID=290746 RepID=A0A914CTB6_9BILA
MLYGLVYCDEVKGEKKNADASVQKKNSTEEKKEAGKLPIETSLNKPDAALEAKNTKPKSQELVDGKDKSKNPPEDKANSNQTAPQKPEEKVPNPNEKVLKSNETGPNLNETGPNLNATGPKIEQNKTDQKPEEKTAQATDTKKEPEKPKNEKNQEINKETDDKNNQEENDQEEKEGDKEQPAKEKGKDASTEKNVQTKVS